MENYELCSLAKEKWIVTIMRKTLLLIAADPLKEYSQSPGGQGTASKALIHLAGNLGVKVVVIDSAQSHMEKSTFINRIKKSTKRFQQINIALKQNHFNSAVIFCSSGLSFIEKSLMAWRINLAQVPTTMCMRSGHFMTQNDNSFIWRLLSYLLLKIPSRHVVQGTNWINYFTSLGVSSQKIDVARNWPREYIKLKKEAKSSPKVINFIFVGWVVRNKGIKELLDAVYQSKKLQSSIIHIVGDGDYMSKAKEFVLKHNLNNIIFYGNKPHKEAIKIISEGDVFVLPSYAEGFPNAIVEAMYLGLPIIASDVGAISDSVISNKNGYLIPPKNTEKLKTAMEEFIINPELVSKYSSKSLEISKLLHDPDKNINVFLSDCLK